MNATQFIPTNSMVCTRFCSLFILFLVCENPRKLFIKADVFAAMSQLQDLVALEQKLGEKLEIYLEAERTRLEKVERFAKNVKTATERAKTAGLAGESLNSPGDCYGIVKRFVSGWAKVDTLLSQNPHAKGKKTLSY